MKEAEATDAAWAGCAPAMTAVSAEEEEEEEEKVDEESAKQVLQRQRR